MEGFFASPVWGAYINFGAAYTWRGLFSEFYGSPCLVFESETMDV